MSDRLRKAFAHQAEVTIALGSPFMGRLMTLMAHRLTDESAVGARCFAWQGDVSAAAQSVPLRLAGALHGLVIEGADAGLAAVYPPHDAEDDVLWAAVEAALTTHETRIMEWLNSAPQTNEVRRAAAIIAGLWWVLERTGPLPVTLSELGASGGLNLSLDRFALAMGRGLHVAPQSAVRLQPDWRGPFQTPQPITVIDRAGVDLNPLDPQTPEGRLRLLAYLWPDQTDRLARTEAAIALASGHVAQGDAAPWIGQRLQTPWQGMHCVYSTIAAQYFPTDTQNAIAEALRAAGAQATPSAPLAHIAMEVDGNTPGAALIATLWTGGAPVQTLLGRVAFHVDWIDWRNEPFNTPVFPLLNG